MKSLDAIRRIKTGVEGELLKLPGVTGVDIGYKYVGGKKTDVLSIRVYVEQKKDVPEKDAVPKQIQGHRKSAGSVLLHGKKTYDQFETQTRQYLAR